MLRTLAAFVTGLAALIVTLPTAAQDYPAHPVIGGKMIGAVGVSGVSSAQDAQIARAGVEALGK